MKEVSTIRAGRRVPSLLELDREGRAVECRRFLESFFHVQGWPSSAVAAGADPSRSGRAVVPSLLEQEGRASCAVASDQAGRLRRRALEKAERAWVESTLKSDQHLCAVKRRRRPGEPGFERTQHGNTDQGGGTYFKMYFRLSSQAARGALAQRCSF